MKNSVSRGKYFSFRAAAPNLHGYRAENRWILASKMLACFRSRNMRLLSFRVLFLQFLKNYSVVELSFVQRN